MKTEKVGEEEIKNQLIICKKNFCTSFNRVFGDVYYCMLDFKILVKQQSCGCGIIPG